MNSLSPLSSHIATRWSLPFLKGVNMSEKIIKVIIGIICVVVLWACGGCEPYTKGEKLLFGAMVLAQYGDYETTRRGHLERDDGPWKEFSPLLDDHPSRDQVFLLKTASVVFFWGMGEINPDYRKLWYTTGIITAGGHAIRNNYMYEERP